MDNEAILPIIYLSIACVLGNTFVACIWLNALHKNPQATGAVKAVLVASATSELLALICIFRLLVG